MFISKAAYAVSRRNRSLKHLLKIFRFAQQWNFRVLKISSQVELGSHLDTKAMQGAERPLVQTTHAAKRQPWAKRQIGHKHKVNSANDGEERVPIPVV